MCNIGPRGRQGGVPENISKMAEEYQKDIKPPYDKDDIISAFECGYMKAQSQKPLTDMTKEEKELLLKYLCMALPYGVICKCYHTEFDEWSGEPFVAKYNDTLENIGVNGVFLADGFSYEIDEIKPYLRPMSSMTDEEKEELLNLLFDKEAKYFYIDEEGLIDGRKFNLFKEGINYPSFCPINIVLYTNWLLEHHIDFMNLIPKDLAIEVTKENNPYKE